MTKSKTGVVFGRFQPFHLGHMQYVNLAKQQCDHLIIGITNADPLHTKKVMADEQRSSAGSNPFTFYERKKMVEGALLENNYRPDSFEIVPFPINFPEFIKYYIPINTIVYLALLDDWGHAKIKLLESVELSVCIVDLKQKLTTATEIRQRIKTGQSYHQLLPGSVYRFIMENKLEERIKSG